MKTIENKLVVQTLEMQGIIKDYDMEIRKINGTENLADYLTKPTTIENNSKNVQIMQGLLTSESFLPRTSIVELIREVNPNALLK